ncbi:MAG: ACP S-malonyltransferase [Firmicutes bacterium]|nr:ACP S-malonyltransferase [Alicyclobacillaceae bacterium]MCL6496378.1 ACP S-malonyltransferase [Bacillota bacterium]
MTRWAVVFPGQGAQYVGMGQDLYHASPAARSTFEEADAALEMALSRWIFEGPEDRLEETAVQQPAILTVSVAAWRALTEARPEFVPALGLGLSLGEYAAYVASGVLEFATAVRICRLRGQAMQEAVPRGLGGMMAVMGLDQAVVEAICQEASAAGRVEPANYNAPQQIVISGLNPGLEAAAALVAARGGRAVRLSVSAPFHSSLLEPAGSVLSKALSTAAFHPARFPVLANVDTEPCTEAQQIVPRLIQQVSHPVRFEQSVRRALAMGVEGFLELGPGRSLAGLIRKIDRRCPVVSVGDVSGLRKALELLGSQGYNSNELRPGNN